MTQHIKELPKSELIIIRLNEANNSADGVYLVIERDKLPATNKYIAIDNDGCVCSYQEKPIPHTKCSHWDYDATIDNYQNFRYITNIGQTNDWISCLFEIN